MIAKPRGSLLKLRLTMIGTWAIVTAVATLVLAIVFSLLGLGIALYWILMIVILFDIVQWLWGPRLINSAYKVKPLPRSEEPWLHRAVEKLARVSGIPKPKLMLADVNIPNAFAYGSPLTGNMVAVTRGLLDSLPKDEVEAVVGHELGHIKHKDIIVMMTISMIPAVLYYMGYTLYFSGFFGGGGEDQGGALLLLIGVSLIALSFVFNLFVFYMSRLREYYADAHSALTVEDGARKLQRALARILASSGRIPKKQLSTANSFRMFLISNPEHAVRWYGNIDELVERIKAEKPSLLEELFSTHPHPAKRFKYLDSFAITTVHQRMG